MASIIQGSANDNLQLIAGTGQSIVFTTDADGSVDLATVATEGYVTAQINNLIDSAPGALDTLNELAASLGDDADFAGTVTTSLGLKANAADVYTQAEVDSALSGKLDTGLTTLNGYGITDAYTITEVDTALTGKLDTGITTIAGYGITDAYTSAEVDSALALKANSADVYTSAEVDSALANKEDAFVTAPTSSVGQAGDLAGQIAFSSTHVYYCTADYTDGVADIWARVGLTLETW